MHKTLRNMQIILRNLRTDLKVLTGFSPEDYAAMWGSVPDGVALYNYSSEHQERDADFLKGLLGEILGLMSEGSVETDDLQPMTLLAQIVMAELGICLYCDRFPELASVQTLAR